MPAISDRARPNWRQRWEAKNIVPAAYKADLIAFLRTYLNDPTRIRGATCRSRSARRSGRASVTWCACATEGRNAGQREGAATFVSGKLDRYFDVTKGKLDRSIDLPVEARDF